MLSASYAGEITFDFRMNPDDVVFSQWQGFDAVSIPGGVSVFQEGEPLLEGIPYRFVLPQGTEITNISVEIIENIKLDGSRDIPPVIYSILSQPIPVLQRSPVYFSNNCFPKHPVVGIDTGNRTGFRLGSFCFVPLKYYPLTGELSLITSARITVEYSTSSSIQKSALTDRQIDTALTGLENIVTNPEMLESCAPLRRDNRDIWANWIVIADTEMEAVLQPLVNHRNNTAGSAEFVSLDWIYSSYTGYDTQEQIRNFLKDAFYNHGLVYALIVGDYGETTRISSLKVGENTLNNVTDQYYADLDGSWDLDGDHLYGERSDGIDYCTDIYVGRFSSDVPGYVSTMVEKTIRYETEAPAGLWRTTAILPGAGLWPDSDYWGSFVCDSIANRIPESWVVRKLYETESWHPTNQIHFLNIGASYMAPQGHGGSSGVYWYYNPPTDIISNSNYTELDNIDKLCVFHSMACMPGELTNIGCIAERLMIWPNGGAIAVMFNSSYGWGTPPSTGPSEWLEIRFAEQLFTYNQNELGVAQAFAKDIVYFTPGVPLLDWVIQENNFLGDPAVLFAAGQTGMENVGNLPSPLPQLHAIYPNPSSGGCILSWSLPEAGMYNLTVYDILGREVLTLADNLLPDDGTFFFDCRDDNGNILPNGCYSVLLSTSDVSVRRQFVILR